MQLSDASHHPFDCRRPQFSAPNCRVKSDVARRFLAGSMIAVVVVLAGRVLAFHFADAAEVVGESHHAALGLLPVVVLVGRVVAVLG